MTGFQHQKTATFSALALAALMASAAYAQTTITVNSVGVQPSADLTTDNDYTRLTNAFASVSQNDTTIELNGTFDLTEANAEADLLAGPGYWTVDPVFTGTMYTGPATIMVDPSHGVDFLYFKTTAPDKTFNDITIDGLTLKGFTVSFYVDNTAGGATLTDVSITNNTVYVGTYSGFGAAYGEGGSSRYTNFAFEDNIINLAVNSGDPVSGTGYRGTAYGGYFNCCQGNQHKGVSVSNNTFNAWADPDLPGATYPYAITNRIFGWYDNNNSNRNTVDGSQTYMENNVFNFGLPDGQGGFQKAYGVGFLGTGVDGEIDGGATGIYSYDGNEFYNVTRCYWPLWFSATNPLDGYVIRDNVFENVGFVGVDGISDDYSDLPYTAAIQNATAGGFGVSGGVRIIFDLNNVVDGVTGIPMLNNIALDPNFFEMEPIDEGLTTFAQTGILAAEITPAPATTFNRTVDDAWTFSEYLVRPTPEEADGPTDVSGEELAFGYNAFGNTIDPGDPAIFSSDPTDPIVVDISVDTEYAPTTLIDKDVTIRLDPNARGFGADGAPVISPTVKSLTDPLFIVASGGKLTLQNLVIDGDTPFSGIKDINKLVDVQAGGELVIENCTLKNAFAAGVNSIDATVTATGSHFMNFNPAIRAEDNSIVTVEDSLIEDSAVGVNVEGAGSTFSLLRNVWKDTGYELFFIQASASLTMQNNVYFSEFDPYFNAQVFEPGFPETLDLSNNWHNEFYGLPGEENANTGLITGDVPVVVSPTEIFEDKSFTAGVLTYHNYDGGLYDNSAFQETGVVSRFDRDLDAWPDVWELANGNFASFDRDNDGWPDGVEAAEGTDPNSDASFPAGTFDIAADLDDNGIVDWYEDALIANLTVEPFLGDVLRNGGVGLSDAVRSLQIVNGQFTANPLAAGDHNALDVTGIGPNSLANPLQVLRFQAAVRDSLPALPGIN